MTWHSKLQLGFACPERNSCSKLSIEDTVSAQRSYDAAATGHTKNRTFLTHKYYNGALLVQRALYPEPARQSHICHAIILYPPAGIALGDALDIDVRLNANAHAVLTTPGAGKWYGEGGKNAKRQDGKPTQTVVDKKDSLTTASQSVTATLADNARLEWLPQENIVFNHANVQAATHIEVAPSASLLAWDITVFGRQAHAEAFEQGDFHNQWLLTRAGEPMVFETVNQSADSRWFNSPLGMNHHHVVGTFWAIPSTEQTVSLPDTVTPLRQTSDAHCLPVQITHTRHGVCIRYLGGDVRACFDAFAMLKDELRRLWWGLDKHSPRIWQT